MSKTFRCPFCNLEYLYKDIQKHFDTDCKVSKKTLKFQPELVPLILDGSKTTTWRLFDDKNLATGDIIIFIKRPELVSFALAKLTSVIEKPLGQLTDDDKRGHEAFASNEKMYEWYTNVYHRLVTPETLVKLVQFELLDQF